MNNSDKKIRIAIVGVGNCASSLVEGIYHYKEVTDGKDVPGLMHSSFGGYSISDVEPVAAFDVDSAKVGKDLSDAIHAGPNCSHQLAEVPNLGIKVRRGPVKDGVPPHLADFVDVAEGEPVEVGQVLKQTKTDVVVNLLPTGSYEASRYYADKAIEAGVGFVNGIPELIVSDKEYQQKAKDNGVPMVGDDFKSQIGATIVNRALIELFLNRAIRLKEGYQLNYGGNTDFVNLVNRGESKHKTKRSALENLLPYEAKISTGFAYMDGLEDTKIANITLKGENFGGAPMELEVKLQVEDSPNAGGVLIDMIRSCKLAADRGVSGALISSSAYFSKHPPKDISDEKARQMLEEFIKGERER